MLQNGTKRNKWEYNGRCIIVMKMWVRYKEQQINYCWHWKKEKNFNSVWLFKFKAKSIHDSLHREKKNKNNCFTALSYTGWEQKDSDERPSSKIIL